MKQIFALGRNFVVEFKKKKKKTNIELNFLWVAIHARRFVYNNTLAEPNICANSHFEYNYMISCNTKSSVYETIT